MDPVILILAVLSGYLVGAISFSRLITHLVSPGTNLDHVEIGDSERGDITELRHYGADTASIKLGARWGCTIGLLDILKTTLPTLAVKYLYPDQPYFLIAAIFCMVGHNWPIFYKFKGGGGMSSIYGGFLAVDWLGALVCSTAGLIFGLVIVKDILVAYMIGPAFMILWLWFTTHNPAYIAYAIIVNILFIAALLPEIREQIKAHREGKANLQAGLEFFPMGRGMLKMMEMMRLKK